MPVKKKLTGNQFGAKVKELFRVIENTEDWEKYVAPLTAKVVNEIHTRKNMTESLEKLNMKYTTARAHLMRALDRVRNKKLDRLRGGQSRQATKLLALMDNAGWENGLTDKEIEIAKTFRRTKNFYETGRQLNLEPSNIAITLYGSTQKLGVINKIKKNLIKHE